MYITFLLFFCPFSILFDKNNITTHKDASELNVEKLQRFFKNPLDAIAIVDKIGEWLNQNN